MAKQQTLQDALGYFQTLPTDVLAAILSGQIDAQALAANELAGRGLNASGEWVGFKLAAQQHADKAASVSGVRVQ